ncbi:MAG: hypothetical protein ABJF23_02400 [Bryobacteraceae bacterium]
MFDKFLSIPRGGVEIGGVLFGTVTTNELRLLTYRPLEIEYLNGPGFALSEQDKLNLIQLIESSRSDPELAGMEPLGWYHSHTRSEIALSSEDIALHERFFPHPQQVALVIKPHKFDPARFAFYLRGAGGVLQGDAPQATFTLQPPAKEESKYGNRPDPPPVTTLAVVAPPAAPPVEPDSIHAVSHEVIRASPRSKPRRGWMVAVAAILLSVSAAVLVRNWFPAKREAAPMWLHLGEAGSQLMITWNRSSPTVAQARSAEILIIDGGRQAATVPLDKESLKWGTITYLRHSGNVEVRMRVQTQADRVLEQSVRFIGPEIPSQPAPVTAVKTEERDPEVLRMKEEMERLKEELVRSRPEGTRARSVPFQQEASVTDPGPRQFTAPPARSASTPAPALDTDMRPPVLTSQTQLNSPALPSPAWQPPPAKPPVIVAPPTANRTAPQSPSSGRAIWTGRLPKGGLLMLDGARPSVGAVSGPLPQRAARFKVYAADLGDTGIVIYSGAAPDNSVEPPSPANGWNLTTYKADAKRVRSVSVVEYPGPQNGWKRLLVRSEDRTLTMLVIDWSELR